MRKISPLLFLACVLVTSCYKDEVPVDYDYLNGQTLIFVPPLGETVDYVVYTWDGVEIATETSMPFILRYELIDQSPGTHTLGYKIVSETQIDGGGTVSRFVISSETFIIK